MIATGGGAASDGDLVRAAQAGDSAALGILLQRHRAALHAHALRLVGHGPQAQDAVQDTFLLALRKIDQVREPDAAAGWLHTALRSVCLTRLRHDHGELPLYEVEQPHAPAAASPEAQIERLALRGWVWTAIGELTEPLRVVAMLRYFGSYSSYEEIASICGVPVGTVRSRLNQVKSKLADAMLATAEGAHAPDPSEALRVRDFLAAVLEYQRTGHYERWVEHAVPELEMSLGRMHLTGRHLLAEDLARDVADGVRIEATQVIAGPGITILEARFINPPDDPFHCPPAISQVHFQRDGMTRRMAVHYARRETETRLPG